MTYAPKPGPYLSDRGKMLVHQQAYEGTPIVTVENYEKWYSLFLIQPDGTVEKIPSQILLDAMTINRWWIDHSFHPSLLLAVAKHYGGEVPDTTLEMVAGRWVLEQGLLEDINYGYGSPD